MRVQCTVVLVFFVLWWCFFLTMAAALRWGLRHASGGTMEGNSCVSQWWLDVVCFLDAVVMLGHLGGAGLRVAFAHRIVTLMLFVCVRC